MTGITRGAFLTLAAALALATPPSAVFAQSAGSAAKPNTTIPEKQQTGPVDPPHDGVIKPKRDTDPDMIKKPPPQSPDETPVIPPRATPGGKEAK